MILLQPIQTENQFFKTTLALVIAAWRAAYALALFTVIVHIASLSSPSTSRRGGTHESCIFRSVGGTRTQHFAQSASRASLSIGTAGGGGMWDYYK